MGYHGEQHRGCWGELRTIAVGSKVPSIEGQLKTIGLERDAKDEPFSRPNRHPSSPFLLPPPSTIVRVSYDTPLVKPRIDMESTENSRLTVPADLPCIIAINVSTKATLTRSICLNIDLLSGLAISHPISKLNVSIVSFDGSDFVQRHAVPELVAEPLPIIVDQKPITLGHDGHMNILVWLDRESRWSLLLLPANVSLARVQHEAVLVIAGVEVEENLSLLVAAKVHMDPATTPSFVVEKDGGANSKLVDFYFVRFRHLRGFDTRQILR